MVVLEGRIDELETVEDIDEVDDMDEEEIEDEDVLWEIVLDDSDSEDWVVRAVLLSKRLVVRPVVRVDVT